MLELNFYPFPQLSTERLVLRKISMDDVEEMFIQRSHPVILKYIKRVPITRLAEAAEFIERVTGFLENNESIIWAITLKGENKLIGSICLWNIEKEKDRAEVGYSLHYDYFGQGIMSEALARITDFGFTEMKLQRIDAYTNKNNAASLALLAKRGFVRNHAFEKDYEDKEELEYNVIYTLKKV